MTPPYPLTPAPAPRRPHWLVPLLVAVALVVVASAAVTAWALTRPNSPPATVAAAATTPAAPATSAQSPEDVACTAAEDIAEADDSAARLAAARRIAEYGKRSSDVSMHIRAQLVSDYADDAAAAAGRSDEDAAQRGLWRSMAEFRELCSER
jgi:hypothetical protein